MSVSGSIELIVEETEIQIDYTYYPATGDTFHNPPEGAGIDINSCTDAFGREREDLAEKLLESDYLIERVEEDLSYAHEAQY